MFQKSILITIVYFVTMNINGIILESVKDEGVQLTDSKKGHMIHHNGVFSKDNQWIVFDTRNDETKIGETSEIGIVNTITGDEKIIYRTDNPTKHGPGVGAASFSPIENKVIFIHGLPSANEEKPYGFTRRTGVAVEIDNPFVGINMDARDVTFPYTFGSLRGGTHSHCWNPNGRIISFTYNDEYVNPDLRTVGVMFDTGIYIYTDSQVENNNGKLYSSIVADVKLNPKAGSDEISKAFDECWIGNNGYINNKGVRVLDAIAFQGNTLNTSGEVISEIFIVDVNTTNILDDPNSVGKLGGSLIVPNGIKQRRITRTENGLSSVRHWLRSSSDGAFIYALAEDKDGIVQIIQCRVNSGEIKYLTNNKFSITNPFNLSSEGKKIAFIGNNNIYLLDMITNKLKQVTNNKVDDCKLVGAPVFSRDDKMLAYNRYAIDEEENSFVQINIIYLS